MKWLLVFIGFLALIHLVSAAPNGDVRSNVLINGSKYKYESFIEVGKGRYVPLFGLGFMLLPEGSVPLGLTGSAAAIFSSGYQSKAKQGLTGPQEVLIAKQVRKSIGPGKPKIKTEIVNKSQLKSPEEE